MEIDQIIFKHIYRLWKRWTAQPVDEAFNARAVRLETMKERLAILASALTSEQIRIAQAECEGGWRANVFFLPEVYAHGASIAENTEFYLVRTCYLAIQKKLALNWQDDYSHSLEQSRLRAEETAPLVLAAIREEFPAFWDVVTRVQERLSQAGAVNVPPTTNSGMLLLYGRWMTAIETKDSIEAMNPNAKHLTEAAIPTTERQAPAREDVETLKVNKEKQQEYALNHSFEKIETADDFNGNWRDFDGSDELNDHAEALQELNMRNVVRDDTPVHSVYQSDFFAGNAAPDAVDNGIAQQPFVLYDEWDERLKIYKKAYCKVFPVSRPLHQDFSPISTAKGKNTGYVANVVACHRQALERLRQSLMRLYNEFETVKKQSSGIEPDLDEVIDRFADIRAGRTPSENIYFSERKRRRDIALLLLVDVSLSTDGYIENKRIIEIEKQSLALFGETLSMFGDSFQIDCFSSRTRNHCEYQTVKSFDDEWSSVRERIGAIEPHGYTRIGPALRHAVATLRARTECRKWVVLLSDGKPNDYDRYEGKYGIADVRKAMVEAEQHHVGVFALTVDVTSRYYLPQMFGTSNYAIVRHPALLPDALSELYIKVIR